MNNRSKAQMALIGTAVLWSTGGILIKSIQLNAFAICGLRSIVAVIFFSFYYKKIKVEFNRDFVISLIAYVGTTLMFVLAIKMTTSANAILFQYIAPVFVCLFSWIIMKKNQLD